MTWELPPTMLQRAPARARVTASSRPDLSNRSVWLLAAVLGVMICVLAIVRLSLPADLQRPGSILLQPAAILGALLLLVPYLFSIGKRSGYSKVPNRLFVLHVLASVFGIALVSLHALARPHGPPLILVGCLALLVITGVVGRVHVSRRMADTFGTKPSLFQTTPPVVTHQLKQVIESKTRLLSVLDPSAKEALFSVTLRHWLSSPLKSLTYARLARKEATLMGTRSTVSPVQAYWRGLHLFLAWLFLAGLVTHIIVVTFFADYVAGDRTIYWWHVRAW